MGQIITFYSYKGGVGRSMALANIGYELARKGHKTLLVDWDLEAPGLERYFSNFKIKSRSDLGLIHLLKNIKEIGETNYKQFIWEIEINSKRKIDLLTSGRTANSSEYSGILQKFNWDDFFTENKGGLFLENLRNNWLKDYDFVLIDSRTGLTDSSGICTILMPDILIAMFTANLQSLFGIRDIVNFINGARQRLDVDRMALTILPIPSRFGTRVEFKESQEWLERISDILGECFSDWVPKWISPIHVFEKIKIPQIDYFTFGEKLAVVEHGISDPEGMGHIFSKISNLLISEFTDLRNFIGAESFDFLKKEYLKNQKKHRKNNEYYDVFLSYPREIYPWVKDLFLPTLKEYLEEDLGYLPKIYSDEDEIEIGSPIREHLENRIEKSKTYVIIITEELNYNNSQWFRFEVDRFLENEKHQNRNMIFPVYYSKNLSLREAVFFGDPLKEKMWLDLSSFKIDKTINSTRIRSQFGNEIERLSNAISASINNFDKKNQEKTYNNKHSDLEFESLLQLAKEYEHLRENMPSGNKRTRAMQAIFNKMKKQVTQPQDYITKLMESESPGERLAAIAAFHQFPNKDHIQWLTERVGFRETPFVGYQASAGLFVGSRAFAQESPEIVSKALSDAIINLENAEYKDPNQYSNILAAKGSLGNFEL